MSELIRHQIQCPDWGGKILIARPIPSKGEPWGCLAPLRGTPWGDLIPIVSGEAFSHALHGRTKPLLDQIGPHPHSLLRKVPPTFRKCDIFLKCLNASSDCHPCLTLPDCYDPPELPELQKRIAATVVLSWRDGIYVFVVIGSEFSL